MTTRHNLALAYNNVYHNQAKTPIDERIAIVNRFLDLFEQHKEEYGKQLTEEMGRPIRYSGGEMNGFLERARFMVSIAKDRLKDVLLTETDKEGFKRWIRKEPMGVCALISAWNVSRSQTPKGERHNVVKQKL